MAKVVGPQFWTEFRRGVALGVMVVLFIVGIALFIRHNRYGCVAWGKPGERVSCRVHKGWG